MTLSDWTADLIGTLLGAGVGFGLAMWWDRYKERERERRDRDTTTESLILELRNIQDRASVAAFADAPVEGRPGAVQIDFSVPFVPRSAFDAAVHSGKLTLLRPDLQEELATIYECVRLFLQHVDKLNTAYSLGNTVEEHRSIMDNAVNYLIGNGPMLAELAGAACIRLEETMKQRPAWWRRPFAKAGDKATDSAG